jgi:signal transduction histidine kinase
MESKHGTFDLQLNAQHATISGDKMHICNVIINLIENAIKYSPNSPHVIIATSNTAQHLEISISDRGIGIAKEYHKRIFEKYFRVPTGDRHDTKGFGLGLAYVQKIVKLHGGTIAVRSEVGHGTTFILSFDHA